MPSPDPEVRRAYFRERYWRLRTAWFAEHGPCWGCGSWDSLEVDHVDRRSKLAAHEIWNWSEARRSEELEKCQPLCNACHVEKTRLERQSLPPGQRAAILRLSQSLPARDVAWLFQVSHTAVLAIKRGRRVSALPTLPALRSRR